MKQAFDLWMFMNRFRNCDLGIYFNEDLHEAIASLNPNRFDTTHLMRPKTEFNIAFIIWNLVDTGGASVPHRFMLENPNDENVRFNQHVLVSNLRDRAEDYEQTESYRYLTEEIAPTSFTHVEPGMGWMQKGRFIENWLHDKQIDFVVAAPCPATLYALASRPALVHGVLSQDCYCFTLGPGAGDLTFLVTTDQVFKYKFRAPDSEKQLKIIMLPLHSGGYIEATTPMPRAEMGVPEDAVVSASTNMWKSCFGDSEVLLEGIAALIRRHPDYHHVFAGTPRCRDNIEFFVNRNPDVRDNIHFIGEVKNIYRLLKSVDFWVNSFPTSGGSDIECALVEKPSIEFLHNRNLTLHGAEFLRSRECDVVSLEEFVALGSRFITDPAYRDNLGAFLREKITREFNKDEINRKKIYGSFLTAFDAKLKKTPALPNIAADQTMAYEKALGLFNAYGRDNWTEDARWDWLAELRSAYPDKPFAWVKAIEEAIMTDRDDRLDALLKDMPADLLNDARIRTMLAAAGEAFNRLDMAVEHARAAHRLGSSQEIVHRVAARVLQAARLTDEASRAAGPVAKPSVADTLPYFYDY